MRNSTVSRPLFFNWPKKAQKRDGFIIAELYREVCPFLRAYMQPDTRLKRVVSTRLRSGEVLNLKILEPLSNSRSIGHICYRQFSGARK